MTDMNAAVMLSLAHYRHKAHAQFAFLVTNAFGLLLSAIYNSRTPDLWPGNAHHTLGWVVTWLFGVHFSIGWFRPALRKTGSSGWRPAQSTERQGFLSMPLDALDDQACDGCHFAKQYRLSSDSGHGTGSRTESPASHSETSLSLPSTQFRMHDEVADNKHSDDDLRVYPQVSGDYVPWQARAKGLSTSLFSRMRKPLLLYYDCIDRSILVLGFIAICTGMAAFGRLFVSFRHFHVSGLS